MKTKNKLNCYVFSNLIISLLTLNLVTNSHETNLVMKKSNNTLNKIYEKNIVETISVPDTIISNDSDINVISISNKSVQSERTTNYQKPSYNSLTGTNLVNYAKQFIGLPYVYAGRSLATGTDCSGFTRLIYQEFGISLGTTVSSQIYSGTYVSREDLEPGDLVFYSYGSVASHVAIYMGNGLIIHESTPRSGVKISSVNIMNYITARRLITSNVVSSSPDVSNNEETKSTEVVEPKEEVKETIIEENTQVEEQVEDKIEEPVEEVVNETPASPTPTPEEILASSETTMDDNIEIVEEENK